MNTQPIVLPAYADSWAAFHTAIINQFPGYSLDPDCSGLLYDVNRYWAVIITQDRMNSNCNSKAVLFDRKQNTLIELVDEKSKGHLLSITGIFAHESQVLKDEHSLVVVVSYDILTEDISSAEQYQRVIYYLNETCTITGVCNFAGNTEPGEAIVQMNFSTTTNDALFITDGGKHGIVDLLSGDFYMLKSGNSVLGRDVESVAVLRLDGDPTCPNVVIITVSNTEKGEYPIERMIFVRWKNEVYLTAYGAMCFERSAGLSSENIPTAVGETKNHVTIRFSSTKEARYADVVVPKMIY